MDIGYYEEIQGQLGGLLIRVDDPLPPTDLALISEFIDHNELGVALEQIVMVLADRSAAISADERADLLALAARMGLGAEVADDLARCRERT